MNDAAPRLRRWRRRLVVAAAILLGVTGAAFCLSPTLLTRESGPATADYIVVLGGGSMERPVRAAELFKEQAAPRILLTGKGDCESNERYLRSAGVPAEAIETECDSRTTRENAKYSAKILNQNHAQRVILVTTWYHSGRALAVFRHYAPEIVFLSRPSYYGIARGDWGSTGTGRFAAVEFFKTAGYLVCYGVWPF